MTNGWKRKREEKSFLPNDIKDQNRKIIFDIFMQEPELAKIEVSKRTPMSSVTVNKIVDYFEKIGIVSVNGEAREGSGGLGRKRVVYSFQPNSYLTIGIQLIGNKLFATLVNLYSEEIDSFEIDEQVRFYEDRFVDLLQAIYEKFQLSVRDTSSKIIGIGIGVDGAINTTKKMIRMRTANNQQEKDYCYEEILKRLSEKLQLPIILENDVNASAVAEFSCLDRGGNAPNDLMLVALGEGVGSGLILNRQLHHSMDNGVGELEYMCFDSEYESRPSSVGWLESKLNLDYLSRSFHFDPDLHPNQGGKNGIPEEERESFANYVSKYLALTIVNAVSLLDIHFIVLTGKTISLMPKEMIAATKRYIRQFTGWDFDIQCSTNEHSSAVGAAILALQKEMANVISG